MGAVRVMFIFDWPFCSSQDILWALCNENASTQAIVSTRSHLRCVSNPLQLDTADSSSKDSFPPTMNKILDDI